MKKFLKFCGIFIIIFGLIVGGLYFLINGQMNIARPFPEPSGPKVATLKCDYRGKTETVEQTLYSSIYDYYKSDTKRIRAYNSGKHEYLLKPNEKDNTIKEVAGKIKALAASRGLSDDELLDLTACMVQNVPYDQPKADVILKGSPTAAQATPRSLYETLYDNAEVCTGKTYLGAALIKEYGYDLGILTFDKEKHMMLGVGVPEGYGSFTTKYGGMELTGVGFKVGTVSDLTAGGPVDNKVAKQQESPTGQTGTRKLGTPSNVTAISTGKIYTRIIQRKAINDAMDGMWVELPQKTVALEQAKSAVTVAENKQENAKSRYLSTKTEADYAAYQAEYYSYKKVYNASTLAVNAYNKLVADYNATLEKYNNF